MLIDGWCVVQATATPPHQPTTHSIRGPVGQEGVAFAVKEYVRRCYVNLRPASRTMFPVTDTNRHSIDSHQIGSITPTTTKYPLSARVRGSRNEGCKTAPGALTAREHSPIPEPPLLILEQEAQQGDLVQQYDTEWFGPVSSQISHLDTAATTGHSKLRFKRKEE